MVKIRLITLLTLAALISGVTASMFVPTAEGTTYFTFHLYLAMALAGAILFIGSSILFLTGFEGFKSRLKIAYTLICVGFSIIGLAMLELPAFLAVGELDGIAKEKGYLVAAPFIVGLITLLVGTVRLTRLFSAKTIASKPWFILLMATTFCGLMFIVPHAPTSVPENEFDASVAAAMLTTVILVLCTINAFVVRKSVGVSYIKGLAWLSLTYLVMILPAAGGVVSRIFYGDDSNYAIAAYTLFPLLPSGLLLLRSGYVFNMILKRPVGGGIVNRDFFGNPKTESNSTVNSIDIVLYAGQLASNPASVQSIMDDLRILTSHIEPNSPISASDQDRLMGIYLKLEDYLVNEDPARKFNKDGLRQEIASSLRLTADPKTFWGALVGTPSDLQSQPARNIPNGIPQAT